jgi:signal transduction histidine kinase
MLLRHLRSKRRINARLEEQNKLIESQRDELVKLNASKDKFLSILAHDIKNPLSSIYGISDLLVNDYESLNDDEKKVFTRDIHTLSGNLFEIINTLLAWSSSQSGLISYHPSEFNINTLTDKVIHLLETIAKQKDIRLVNDTQPGLQVKADENMINSVLFNLIANSIKFSYKNSEIRVTASEISGMVHMAVIDTGQGLSPENQAKLFRYDQHYLGKGTAGESGTGLGLILCKDFVEKNGGTISVKSEPGKGSTFTFTLAAAEK